MRVSTMRLAGVLVFALGSFAGMAVLTCLSQSNPQAAAPGSIIKQVGTIKSISGTTLILTPDSGPETTVIVQQATRMVRIAPGQKDLKNASPIALGDLQVGDRILVRGNGEAGRKPLTAASIVVMKASDLEVKQQRDREDWQRRGVGGLVNAANPAAGTIVIATGSFANKSILTIHTDPQTVLRRYAPDSVKFDDAKPGTLADIKVGDQLRARGTRSDDGKEFKADEIVSGTFRNIAGTVTSVDTNAGTITVVDAATKKPVIVKVTPESNARNLPPEMGRRMAMRMAGGPANSAAPSHESPSQPPPEPASTHRGGDLQQIFGRLPAITIAQMQKGDAVMIVSTQGDASGAVTAISLLDGAEPIMAAAHKSGEGMNLSPWTVGGQGGEEPAQ